MQHEFKGRPKNNLQWAWNLESLKRAKDNIFQDLIGKYPEAISGPVFPSYFELNYQRSYLLQEDVEYQIREFQKSATTRKNDIKSLINIYSGYHRNDPSSVYTFQLNLLISSHIRLSRFIKNIPTTNDWFDFVKLELRNLNSKINEIFAKSKDCCLGNSEYQKLYFNWLVYNDAFYGLSQQVEIAISYLKSELQSIQDNNIATHPNKIKALRQSLASLLAKQVKLHISQHSWNKAELASLDLMNLDSDQLDYLSFVEIKLQLNKPLDVINLISETRTKENLNYTKKRQESDLDVDIDTFRLERQLNLIRLDLFEANAEIQLKNDSNAYFMLKKCFDRLNNIKSVKDYHPLLSRQFIEHWLGCITSLSKLGHDQEAYSQLLKLELNIEKMNHSLNLPQSEKIYSPSGLSILTTHLPASSKYQEIPKLKEIVSYIKLTKLLTALKLGYITTSRDIWQDIKSVERELLSKGGMSIFLKPFNPLKRVELSQKLYFANKEIDRLVSHNEQSRNDVYRLDTKVFDILSEIIELYNTQSFIRTEVLNKLID